MSGERRGVARAGAVGKGGDKAIWRWEGKWGCDGDEGEVVRFRTRRRNEERGAYIQMIMEVRDMQGGIGLVMRDHEVGVVVCGHIGLGEFSDLIMW